MYPHLKKRFKIADDQIFKLIRNPDYEEIFNDYESMCNQFEQFKSDRSLHQINHELISELEEEISTMISKYKSKRM